MFETRVKTSVKNDANSLTTSFAVVLLARASAQAHTCTPGRADLGLPYCDSPLCSQPLFRKPTKHGLWKKYIFPKLFYIHIYIYIYIYSFFVPSRLVQNGTIIGRGWSRPLPRHFWGTFRTTHGFQQKT